MVTVAFDPLVKVKALQIAPVLISSTVPELLSNTQLSAAVAENAEEAPPLVKAHFDPPVHGLEPPIQYKVFPAPKIKLQQREKIRNRNIFFIINFLLLLLKLLFS